MTTPTPTDLPEAITSLLHDVRSYGDAREDQDNDKAASWIRQIERCLTAALSAAAPAVAPQAGAESYPPSGWKPIDSAPRNGSWFIAVEAATGRRRMVRWADEFDRLPINDEEPMWNTLPTHWQPMPEWSK